MEAFLDFIDEENVETVCAGTFGHSPLGGGIFGPSPLRLLVNSEKFSKSDALTSVFFRPPEGTFPGVGEIYIA